MVNRPLIKALFVGEGWHWGGTLRFPWYFVGISWHLSRLSPPFLRLPGVQNIYLFVRDLPSPADACIRLRRRSSHPKELPDLELPNSYYFLEASFYTTQILTGCFCWGPALQATPSRYVLLPSRELTYPPKMRFWRWCSFSQGGIC